MKHLHPLLSALAVIALLAGFLLPAAPAALAAAPTAAPVAAPDARCAPVTPGDAPGQNLWQPVAGTPPHPNPDLTLVAHRWQIRGQDLDYGEVALRQGVFAHSDGGEGLDVPIGAQRGQILQQVVGDDQTTGAPVVAGADDQVSWLPVIGKIIGEGADGLPEFVGVVNRHRALDTVGLQFGQQGLQLFLAQHHESPQLCRITTCLTGVKYSRNLPL